MARRGPKKKYVYGHDIRTSIERGDVFYEDRSGRILRVLGRIYHQDLTVSYVFDVLGGRVKRTTISERTFNRAGGGGFRRIYKTPRATLMEDHSGAA